MIEVYYYLSVTFDVSDLFRKKQVTNQYELASIAEVDDILRGWKSSGQRVTRAKIVDWEGHNPYENKTYDGKAWKDD